jgi:hypothetical protein
VTFHEKNLIPDKYAILGNLISNENALWLVRCRRRITEFFHHKRSKALLLRDMVVKHYGAQHLNTATFEQPK